MTGATSVGRVQSRGARKETIVQIGLISDCLPNRDLATVLQQYQQVGIHHIEIGTGNFSSAPHCELTRFLHDPRAREAWLDTFVQHGITISALNCSGNVLDGNVARRTQAQQVFRDTVQLAALIGVQTVVCMSGCPGEPAGTGQFPNWVTCDWQPEFLALLHQQWHEIVIPFWQHQATFLVQHNVRVAIELHPGQVVYNPATFLQLHQVTGDVIGINLDPSHLFWQGIEPIRVIERYGRHIFHVHAKDCWIDEDEMALNGGLDTRHGSGVTRVWQHCLWGDGHDEQYWQRFVQALADQHYTGVLSIEYAGRDTDVISDINRTRALIERVLPA
jgi:sugar phosphate isomerase/epimerase